MARHKACESSLELFDASNAGGRESHKRKHQPRSGGTNTNEKSRRSTHLVYLRWAVANIGEVALECYKCERSCQSGALCLVT